MLVPAGCPLTARQFEVLALIAGGMSQKEIAAHLFIGRTTVRTHLSQGCRRLDVRTTGQAVATVARAGWLTRRPPPAPESPLAVSHPFLHAYLREFDRWLASGMRDDRCRDGMRIALWGAQHTRTHDGDR